MLRFADKTPLPEVLLQIERNSSAVACRAVDYPAKWEVSAHEHAKHQLIYAVSGVMSVRTAAGYWVVPPSRALWMPAGMTHAIRCIGEVHMRSVFVRQDAAAHLPRKSSTVEISPLLRELILSASRVSHPYRANSRDGRLMALVLDELKTLPILPLHLPYPKDARILRICQRLADQLDDSSTLSDWAKRLAIDVKTIQRLFAAQTGMTFGQWRQQARLLRALELLATGEKVIDVALSLGYDSPGAFATMFRKQFGQVPSQFFGSESASS